MIRLKSINKEFKNKKRIVPALNDINLTFKETGLCFIVGKSGAGKSSLLNIISLQDRATSGNLIIDDVDTLNLKRKDLATLRSKYFGIVFQDLNLINDFSVFTNISLGLELQKKKVTRDEVIEVLNKLHLPNDIIDEKVKNLSGGQKQRVAIARTLIKNPKVIICDEPTGSIDNKNGLEIMAALKEISKDKLVIIVSHDLAFASTYADRIINIEEGHIVSDNNPVEEYDVEEKLNVGKHNHLSFLSMIKLALSSMKQSIPKLIFTMIGFIISLAMLSVSLTINSCNISDAVENVIASDNVTFFTLERLNGFRIEYSSPIPQESGYFLSEEDMEIIQANYDESLYVVGHTNIFINDSVKWNVSSLEYAEYKTNGIASITREQIDVFGFDLVGRVPNGEYHEIMLTSYTCYKLGWLTIDEMNDKKALQNIINNYHYTFNYSGSDDTKDTYNISGILNTHRIVKETSSPGYTEYEAYSNIFNLDCVVFLSQSDMGYLLSLENSTTTPYHKVYVSTKNRNYSNVDAVLEQFDNELGTVVDAKCIVDYVISGYHSLQLAYGTLSGAVGLILLVISAFALIGYMRLSVKLFMKNITILRSLGLTGTDSSMIFILQSVFISLICIIFSSIPYVVGLYFANYFVLRDRMTNFVPLPFSFPILLLVLLGMIIISSIITTISVALVFRKKTIKVEEI